MSATSDDIDSISKDGSLGEISELLSSASEHLASIKGKDIILFIGKTGVGKSSAINYLKGIDYTKKISGRGKFCLEKVGEMKEPVKVGHSVSAETFYPQVVPFTDGRDNLFYCDVPGYLDNDSRDKAVCANVLRQAAIKSAHSIKAIVICYPFDPNDTREANLFELIELLNDYVEEFTQLPPDKLYFLVNKADNGIEPKHFLRAIEAASEHEQKKLDKHEEALNSYGDKLEELKKAFKGEASRFLSDIEHKIKSDEFKQKPESNVVELRKNIRTLKHIAKCVEIGNRAILQPTNQGKRAELVAALSNIAKTSTIPITTDQFKLPLKDAIHNRFNTLVAEEVSHGIQVIEQLSSLKEEAQRVENQLQEKKRELDLHREKLVEAQRAESNNDISKLTKLFDESKFSRVSAIHAEVSGMKDEAKDLEDKLYKLKNEVEAMEKDDTLIEYWVLESAPFPVNQWIVRLCAVVGIGMLSGGGLPAMLAKMSATVGEAVIAAKALTMGQWLSTMGVAKGLYDVVGNFVATYFLVRDFSCPDNIEFEIVQPHCNYGWFIERDKRPYRVTFIPHPLRESKASIKGFIRAKNKPENIIIAQRKRETLKSYEQQLDEIRINIGKKEKKAEEEKKEAVRDKIENLRKMEKNIEHEESELKSKIGTLTNSTSKKEQWLNSKEKVYHLIYDINKISSFSIKDIEKFINEVCKRFSWGKTLSSTNNDREVNPSSPVQRYCNSVPTPIQQYPRGILPTSLGGFITSTVSSSNSSTNNSLSFNRNTLNSAFDQKENPKTMLISSKL